MQRQIWQRQENESPLWFARFDVYRAIGPHRTIEEAFRRSRTIEGFSAARPGGAWYDKSEQHQWLRRAQAWDTWNREELQRTEAQRRIDMRERRLQIIDAALDSVLSALKTADIPNLDIDAARANLPTFRMLLRDLLSAQRHEIGLPVAVPQGSAAAFSADDLAAAQAELSEWEAINASPQ